MVIENIFLFGVAFLWTIFASIQDIRKREVSNWLNFSLIALALAYKAAYSVFYNDYTLFLFGLIGFVLFFILAYGMYYLRAFAGGDAKLLMAYGTLIPFTSLRTVLIGGFSFLLVLFVLGTVYSLIYSLFIVIRRWKIFKKEILSVAKKRYYLAGVSLGLIVVMIVSGKVFGGDFIYYLSTVGLVIMTLIYYYISALDKCLIAEISPFKLAEGDWLEEDIRVGGKWIRKSVHGLSIDEIKLLRKHGKKAVIREGIPFVPAFLITLLVMVFALTFLSQLIERLAYLLF